MIISDEGGMAEYQHIKRTFGPVWDAQSSTLILGSFPSVKSREAQFYYGHPQNRFWRVLAAVLGCDVPESVEEKRKMLLCHHIALWDVLEACDISGSCDSTIKNAVPVDIMSLLNNADIRRIYCNGATAYNLFMRHLYPICGIEAVKLPSTSPANAVWTYERLCDSWQVIAE